jgi:hypothetical protein
LIFWFNALRKITGEYPDKGKLGLDQMREIWKKWSIENGY